MTTEADELQMIISTNYHCFECGQNFAKIGNGSMGEFKSHLDKPSLR